MLKNKSHFKKSYGDEAGRAPKKGINHQYLIPARSISLHGRWT